MPTLKVSLTSQMSFFQVYSKSGNVVIIPHYDAFQKKKGEIKIPP